MHLEYPLGKTTLFAVLKYRQPQTPFRTENWTLTDDDDFVKSAQSSLCVCIMSLTSDNNSTETVSLLTSCGDVVIDDSFIDKKTSPTDQSVVLQGIDDENDDEQGLANRFYKAHYLQRFSIFFIHSEADDPPSTGRLVQRFASQCGW